MKATNDRVKSAGERRRVVRQIKRAATASQSRTAAAAVISQLGEARRNRAAGGQFSGYVSRNREEVRRLRQETRDTLRDMARRRKESRAALGTDTEEAGQPRHPSETGAAAKARPDAARQDPAETSGAREPVEFREKESETCPRPPKVSDFESQLLDAIGGHPEGVSLAAVAEGLGTAPVVLGRAVKNLLENGRIRKEDKLYFPS
ncbi:MAG: hypothetical protein HYX96_07485 [Chloroflexi bacterium]|nr:hypothetical protein [Chloroflexota bacterium]